MRTFRFHDNWLNYRGICESLRKEIYLYNSRINDYSNRDPEAIFINRVESIISKENTVWIEAYSENNQPKDMQ